jgi:VCBS repeat-containing protein
LPVGSHQIDTFTVINLKASSNPGTLTIALNRAPIAFDVSAQVANNGAIAIDAAHGLLRGAFDPDGDQLHVSAVGKATIPASTSISGTYGHLTVNTDGSLKYLADNNFQKDYTVDGTLHDTFTFTISDGFGGTATANLSFDIVSTVNNNTSSLNSSLSLGFKLLDASFDLTNGHVKMSGPNVNMLDISTAGKLIFSDGTISPNSSNPLVSNLFYDVKNQDVWSSHLDPASHYDQYGWHEGRDPNALFSTNGYLAANQDVARAGINPLSHYDANGWKEGRDPSANFDNELYLLNNPDVKAAGIDPLAHYLQSGQAEGRQAYAAIGNAASFTHGSFDAEYYLLANPDVAKAALASGGDTFNFAFQHYEANGWHEGRMADAYFDSAYYLAHNPDVAAAGIDPLFHYDQVGWKEGRDPSAVFHSNAYLAANPDVAAAHIDPLTHYLQYGADEGRHLA